MRKKSSAGADTHPFWTWWYLIYTLLSATLLLNVRIIWLDTFSNLFSSYVTCVCNHCHQTNQIRCSMMVLAIHFPCVYDAFLLIAFLFFDDESENDESGSWSSGTCTFPFPLKKPLVVSVAQYLKWWNALFHFLMVNWWSAVFHFAMVKWWIHFLMVKWRNLVKSKKYVPMLVKSQKYVPKLVESQKYVPKLVMSQKYFPAQNFLSFKSFCKI